MSASTAKKVIIDRFDRSVLRGFIQQGSYRTAEGIELMSPEGSLTLVPYDQIKCLSFVRDLEGASVLTERREFLARPKAIGLWIEFRFLDGDSLEASVSNNLLDMEDRGLLATPPETAGNAQRIFVPRAALAGVSVLGVVGKPKPKRGRAPAGPARQISLFQ